MAGNKKLEIPELDFQNVGDIPFDEISDELAEDLGRQFLEKSKIYGCVQLINHGLPIKFINEFEDAATQFFSLPDDVKLQNKRNLVTLEGYANGELEPIDGNPDEFRETYSITSPDHSFPYNIPSFKRSSAKTFNELILFSKKMLKMLEAGLGLNKNTLFSKHNTMGKGLTMLTVLNYPRAPDSIPIGSARCGAHFDITTFSFQFQRNLGGFQILHENEWKYADVDRTSIMVFYGKSFEILTGNKFIAPKHRVILSGEEQRKDTRKSIVFFVMPDKDAELTNIISDDETNSIIVSDLFSTFFDMYLKNYRKK